MRKLIGILGMIVGLSGSLMANPYPFPVPFIEKDHAGLQGITFRDLPASGNIKIVAVSGEEVRKLDITPNPGTKLWDLKNNSGKEVATGVYLYFIDGGGQQTSGKVVVIR